MQRNITPEIAICMASIVIGFLGFIVFACIGLSFGSYLRSSLQKFG